MYLNDEIIAFSSQEQPQAIYRFVRLLSQKDSNYFLRCLFIPKILFFSTISNFSLLFRKLLLKQVLQVLNLHQENRVLMIQRRKRKKTRKKLLLRQKKLQIKRNQQRKLQAQVKKAQMNLKVNQKVLLMQSHNSSVKDLELLQILVVLMQKFKKQTIKQLYLKKIKKLNLVPNLTQMIVIHQKLQLKRLLQNKKLQLKKLPLKSNHLQKNLRMTLMIQMTVNQAVPKMLNQFQKLKQNLQQRPQPKKLNHLLNQVILTQNQKKKKAKQVKQVKSQQKNNKMQ